MGTHSSMTNCLKGTVNFESGEHESIGDKVLLRYDSESIYGKDFGYTVGSNTLSYGLVVALAGDFYGNFTSLPGDVEQISDKWDSDPESSIALGLKLAKSLSSDQAGYLTSVLSTMKEEEDTVNSRMKRGEDVAQIFDSIGTSYDTKYTTDTMTVSTPLGAYPWIALCNWDHFGQDAEKAYSAVHTAALRQAKKAHDGDQADADTNLKEAYFLEGYAQHFLTDLFSSGHLRTPRRILHRNLTTDPNDPENDPTTPNIEFYPADRCAQKMHNEDCASGLWVTNKTGDSWATYGDKQLWSGKSNQCFLQAVKAAQAGVTEVWETRDSGIIPSASDFAALQLTPILDNLNSQANFAGLFQERQDEPGKMLYRANFDRRDEFNYSKMPEDPSFFDWQSMLRKISESGEDTNMYPFTRQFLSPTLLLHIREIDDSHMIFNTYGPVDSGTYGAEWTITVQTDVEFPEIVGDMQWIKATSLGYGVRSLVGRFKPSSSAKWSTHHLGIKVTADDPSLVDVVWSYTLASDNNSWTPGDIVYGGYCQDSSDIGMIKYWTNGPRGASKLELWTIDASLQNAPVKQSLVWSTIPLNFMLSYQIQSDDTFKTFIGYGFDSTTSSTTWYFSTWTGGYSTQVLTTVSDAVSFPAQVLLSGKFGTDDNGYRLVRVFYGPTFINESRMRIDILNPSRDSTTGQITFGSDPVTKTVLITWGAYFATDYLTWFLADASSDNLLDLVALAVMPDSSLTVVVFPGLPDFTFGSPITSNITLDPTVGKLLTAPFLTHLTALKARFTYPEKTITNVAITSPAAILALFDNYGILGARMLAPVSATGTWNFEFKGQTPAISGQPSQALGLTDKNWMGRGERPQAIGLILE